MNGAELLNLSAQIGKSLVENGAEIYRVEESVSFLLRAYGMEDSAVFAIPSFLLITLGGADGQALTKGVRILWHTTDLYRLDRLNALCRWACEERPDLPVLAERLRLLEARKGYPFAARLAACGLVGGSFAAFFGGGWRDALCAAAAGVVTGLVCRWMDRLRANRFFRNLAAGMLASFTVLLLAWLGLGVHTDAMIIGCLMNLVPGVALTSFMQNVIAGDLIAGLTRLAEALLIAVAVALGTALALAAFPWEGRLGI